MRFALVTLYDSTMADIGQLTEQNKQQYAIRHGYGFHCFRKLLDPSRPGSWNKIPAILSVLADYDYVFWSDADAAILEPHRKLEEFIVADAELIFGNDLRGITCGNFFIRNSHASRAFLDRVYDHEPINMIGAWEQETIQQILETEHGTIAWRCVGDVINRSFYQPGRAFILHPYGWPLPFREALIRFALNPKSNSNGEDLWLLSYFQNRPGRFLDLNHDNDSPCATLAHAGWAGTISGQGAELLKKADVYKHFHAIEVVEHQQLRTRTYQVTHWLYPLSAGIEALWKNICDSVIITDPGSADIWKQAGFGMQIHRTERLLFLRR